MHGSFIKNGLYLHPSLTGLEARSLPFVVPKRDTQFDPGYLRSPLAKQLLIVFVQHPSWKLQSDDFDGSKKFERESGHHKFLYVCLMRGPVFLLVPHVVREF